jgi:uncharacterized spore protein YtfJ
METTFHKELLHEVTELIKTEVKTETVVGQPFTLGNFTCVPVMRIGLGLGAGGGLGEDKNKAAGAGGGAGGGFGVDPLGFLVTQNDMIQFIPTHNSKGLNAAMEKVPDLLSRFMDLREKEKAAAV